MPRLCKYTSGVNRCKIVEQNMSRTFTTTILLVLGLLLGRA